MSASATVVGIKAHLADLEMPGSLEVVDDVLGKVDSGALSTAAAIEQLLAAQVTLRRHRRLSAAMHASRLPALKTLDTFDFTFQPSIDRQQILNLHELGFVERKENVVFLGPAGVGKTHLAISLAVAAAERGRRIYYGTLADLVLSLVEAERLGRLRERLATLKQPSLLVVDEIGYLPITANGANLSSSWSMPATRRTRWSSPRTRASRTGATSSATPWPPLLCWTAFSTTATSSTSPATPIACVTTPV